MKGILMNGDMVRAILDGRKTETRRIIKHLPQAVKGAAYNFRCAAPYQPGAILYVRETWARADENCGISGVICGECHLQQPCYLYKATPDECFVNEDTKWKPSIHMPKKAARIFLKVKDVRVERLQDMPHDGPKKEGIHYDKCPDGFTWESNTNIHNCYISPMGAMKALWDSTVKKSDIDRYGWDANPWVWVISFEMISLDEAKVAMDAYEAAQGAFASAKEDTELVNNMKTK